jgi:hypothetical protein
MTDAANARAPTINCNDVAGKYSPTLLSKANHAFKGRIGIG